MRVGRALCLFSLAHSLVRSSAVLVKPKGELLAQSLVQVLAEAVGEAFSTHGSLKGELLARSLVQSKWKSMLFKGKPNGKILCASHG